MVTIVNENLEELSKKALAVDCLECDAPAGSPCVDPDGVARAVPHGLRSDEAKFQAQPLLPCPGCGKQH